MNFVLFGRTEKLIPLFISESVTCLSKHYPLQETNCFVFNLKLFTLMAYIILLKLTDYEDLKDNIVRAPY